MRVMGRWCAVLLLVLASCESLPQAPRDPNDMLSMAQGYLDKGKYAETLAALEFFEPTALPSTGDRFRWYLLGGTALYRSNERWEAYQFIKDYVRKEHYHQPLADLLYRIGEDLAASKSGFWAFYSDRDRSKVVLREFVTNYPHNPHYYDAQYRLAEMSYEDGEYEQARERFTKIFESPWKTKALFRVAMCYFRRLEGAEYDQEEMTKAMQELTHFLERQGIENPEYRTEATAALRQVRSELAEKQGLIADFYATLGNRAGERHHLTLAASGFPDTEAGRAAAKRLGKMPPPPTAKPETGGPAEEAR